MIFKTLKSIRKGWTMLTAAMLLFSVSPLHQATAAPADDIVYKDSFDSFESAWHTAGGDWHDESGELVGDGRTTDADPSPENKYAYIEHSAPDTIVTADVTPRDWDSVDHRIGLSARVKGGAGDTKWNLIFHDGKLSLLEEGVAWRKEIPFTYVKGQTYEFKMSVIQNRVSGKVWKAGDAEPADWMVSDTCTSQLSADGVGLYAGHAVAAFDNLRIVYAPSFSVQPLQPGNVFTVGETPGLKLALSVSSAQAQTYSLDISLRDAAGQTVSETSEQATVQDGQPIEKTLLFDHLLKGYYTAELRLNRNGENIQTVNTSLALVDPHADTDGKSSPFGIGSDGAFIGSRFDEQYVTQRDTLLEKMGARWTREEFFWNSVQPEKDGPYHWEQFDFAAEQAREHKLNIMGIIDYFSDWSMPYGDNKNVEMDQAIANFAKYAGDIVKYYKPNGTLAQAQGWTDGYGISAWEIWNEPPTYWSGTAEQFGQLVKAASAAVRQADPNATIIASNGGDSFDQQALDQAGPGSYDDLAIHLYPGPIGPEQGQFAGQAASTRNFLDRNELTGDGIWVTEFGWDTYQVSELDQASYLVRANAELLEAGTARNFMFTFNYGSEPPGWSLVHPDLTPKPSFAAYAEMTHQLEGLQPAGSIPMGSAIRAQLFDNGGDAKALIWSTEEKGTLKVIGSGVHAFDLMGNPVGTADAGTFEIPLTGSPVYLSADGLKAKQLGQLVQDGKVGEIAPLGVAISPLNELPTDLPSLQVTVSNRTNLTEQGDVALTLPDGWSVLSNELAYGPLKPGDSQKLDYRLTKAVSDPENEYDVKANASTSDGRVIVHEEKLRALASNQGTPVIDGDLSDWNGAMPVTIDSASQIVGIPNWTPEDLSVKAYTMWDDQNYYFGAIVTDDHHVQNNTGSDIWQGDSFQIYFDMNNDKSSSPNSDDQDLGLAWNPAAGPQVYRWTGGAYQGAIADVKLTVKQNTQGQLVYEAAIPLAELGAKLQPGHKFGFDMLMNDDDGNSREGWGWWTPGVGNAWDPSQWSSWNIVQTLPLAALEMVGGKKSSNDSSLHVNLASSSLIAVIQNEGVQHLELNVNGKSIKLEAKRDKTKPGELPLHGSIKVDLSAYARPGDNSFQVGTAGPKGGSVNISLQPVSN